MTEVSNADIVVQTAKMNEEHQAWIELCARLRIATGVSADTLNEDPKWTEAFNQIKYWGETLHQLRKVDSQYDDKAYTEYKQLADLIVDRLEHR